MRNIHVNRAGQALGQFSSEEILEGLRTGRFQPTDLAWASGEPEWKPLAEFATKLQATSPTATAAVSPPLPEGTAVAPAWERRAEIGLLPAIFETIQEILLNPGLTFSRMKTSGGLGSPLLYFMILGCLGTGVGTLYQFGYGVITSEFDSLTETLALPVLAAIGLVALLIFVPIFVLLSAFLGAGMTHLFLMLVGGAKRDFETTFRVVSYSYGTASILNLVPLCGSYIYSLY
ncbi:MAG: YIP1 family protein, partial [Verrucomicrobiia bacterium]